MAIESASFVSQLVSTNPAGGDNLSSADDHLRLIKSVLVATFPELRGEVSATAGEFNYLRGVNDFIQDQLDLIDGDVSVLSANLSLQIHVTSAALQTSIHDLSQTLQTIIDAGGGSAASGLAALSATLHAEITALSANLDTKIEALASATDLANLSATLDAKIDTVSAQLSTTSSGLSTRITNEVTDRQTTSANLDTKIENLSSTLQSTIATLSSTLHTTIDSHISTLSSTLQTQIEAHGVPAGSVFWFASATPPSGYLECNGTAVSRTTYSALFSVVAFLYGSGNGSTTFNLPDLRGEFIRGWDNSRGVDSGRVFGSNQTDEFESHAHGMAAGAWNSFTQASGGDAGTNHNMQSPTDTYSAGGATETRPRNLALLPCIKT